VLVVGPGARTPGGIWSVTATLLASPLAERYRMRHVATHRDGGVRDKLEQAATGLGRIAVALARRQVDLVWAHVSADAAFWRKGAVLLLCRVARVPFVLHIHGSRFAVWYDGAGRVSRAMARAVLRGSALVVTLSPAWEAKVRSITPCRTVAIMNPVRIPPPADPAGRVPGRIVCFGQLGTRKGTRVLIRALAELRRGGTDASLVLAGDGDPAPFLAEAAALGVAEHVTIHSWLAPDRVAALLDSAAAFALPSQNEGLPVALLEAMAHRLPCVVTPVGGIPDLITDGVNGLLVPPDDPPALAGALARILDDPAAAAELAAAGHADVARHCDLGVVVDQWDRAFRDVLARRGRR